MSDHSEGLLQFATDIHQRVLTRSEREGEEEFAENVFTDMMLELLGDAGEVEDASLCPHQAGVGAQSLKVNAWALSGGEYSDECLDLFVTDYSNENPPCTIYKDEMKSAFVKLRRFALKAFESYHFVLEESSQVFDACQRIHEILEQITRIRFILLTDGIVKSDPPAAKDEDVTILGRECSFRTTYHVWDIERFYRLASSGQQQEPIEIDFEEQIGAAVPCLAQPDSSPEYAAYLAIIPGSVLAHLYGEYGSRLLERNVRSFLQARGKINAGIRKTIRQEPQRFLAYNNGLSMTAAAVELVTLPSGGQGLKRVCDLQIVNGGQTTASIFHAQKKDKADLAGLFVQAKLTVIADPERVNEIVPLISEYSNSQNKVQTADFRANDLYHRELEKLSRSIWAPAREGSQKQTHWYYERARGQYQDDLVREGTPGRQKEFQSLNPTAQFFTKTDLAKFIQTWDQRPHVVSKGAQFCFNDFSARMETHILDEQPLNDTYFQRLIAKAILFKHTEQIMKRLAYSGYRANLVTYTLARIAWDTKGRLDLIRIWREQTLSAGLVDAIERISVQTWDHITHPPGAGNVTQFCKQASCWETFRERDIPFPQVLLTELKSSSSISQHVTAKDNRPEAVRKAMELSSQEWFSLAEWGKSTGTLIGLDIDIVSRLGIEIGYGRVPTQTMARDAMKRLEAARKAGYRG